MTRVTLLDETGATKTVNLARIPTIGEYLFVENQTLYVKRVVRIPTLFAS